MSTDRRRFAREPVERPCKVLHCASLRFAPGRTANLSEGGALLRVVSARPYDPGDSIEVAIGSPTSAVLSSRDLIPARVVRAEPEAGSLQALAVEFVAEAGRAAA